ncbi:DUF2911 domain-containing protein [Gelidibacter salicanalis]|uniref:DUF2911 domain-containing protein n=1 Tax=Gelidibacter salicanalis TaxID=291193 RepID=A0A934KP43_9FLAO|nr:DUF2911 domain-containing protein [Gelidibacter salicanalis]MBJ7881269.1 DUF2911 domain-containing protein [Gelidibacter salicanalis]
MKTIIKTVVLTLALVFSYNAHAQKFPDLDKSPMDAATYPGSYKISEKDVKVVYSRPQLNGRDVAKLVPHNEVWRTGANEATEITFYKPVTFGDTKVKPGTYTLFTIPGEKEWTVILSSDINVWGAYTYKQDHDVARMKATASQSKDILEAFSIVFDESESGAVMHMGWGTTRVKVPISF